MDSLKDIYLLKAAELLRFTAFLPGDQDTPRRGEMLKRGLPLVCANIGTDGRLAFQKFILKETAGVKVGITGLWSKATFALLPDTLKTGLTFITPDSALQNLRDDNGGGVDLWVVMTQGPDEFDRELMERYDWIDIITSGGRYDSPERTESGKGYIVPAGQNCEFAGKIVVIPGNKRNSIVSRITPVLLNDPPPKPEFKALTDEYYAAWYKVLEARRAAMPQDGRIFHGNWYCTKCHQREYDSWAETSHAKAFAAISDNPEKRCLPCHTTGFGYPTGFWDLDFSPKMAGVGCEMCHKLPRMSAIISFHPVEPITPKSCGCHQAPFDPDFDFGEAVAKVLH